MLYDVKITPAQLRALADWTEAGEGAAAVELAVGHAGVLWAQQGDSVAAWDRGGVGGSQIAAGRT